MGRADQITKTKRQIETLSTRIARGLDFLNQLAQRSGQDTPEFNRYFSEWEKTVAEEKRLLRALEGLERSERVDADRIATPLHAAAPML